MMTVEEQWWRDKTTIMKDLHNPQGNGLISLHTKQINGIFQYALVWWHYGSPTLQLLFADGIILFDSEA